MGLCLGKPASQQVGTEEVDCQHKAATSSGCYTKYPSAVERAASGHDSGMCLDTDKQQGLETAGHAVFEQPISMVHSNDAGSNGTAAQAGKVADATRAAAEPAASNAVNTAPSRLPQVPDKLADSTRQEEMVTAAVPTVISEVSKACSGSPDASAAGACTPAAQLAPTPGSKLQGNSSVQQRTVKFATPDSDSSETLVPLAERPRNRSSGEGSTRTRKSLPRRSRSLLPPAPQGDSGQLSEAVLAKQVEILRSNKMGKLRQRRGGLDSSFQALQDALAQNERPLAHVNTRAAGLKHIGFGPFKRENQDEFFIQVGDFGGQHSSNLFCVFDGHGSRGKDAALYSRQLLPRLLDAELAKYFERVHDDNEEGLKGAVELLITEVFGETERNVVKFGVNLASSGTTASVAYQKGNRLWIASAGDSRAILCSRNAGDQWRALPLTIDHRPRRNSERERIEAAGARVAPKRLPSGRMVGEPRLWLQNARGPGLLLSRSLGDLTAATVGCTSDPEVSYTTLRPGVDQVLVMASDGVWDVLTNEQVCDIVVESPDPHIACRRVLDAALYEWEERMSADNITVLVVEFDWGEEGSLSAHSMEQFSIGGNHVRAEQDAAPAVSDGNISVPNAAATRSQ